MVERSRFLMPSPFGSDAGFPIGRHPAEVSLVELRELGHPESPGRAIRAKCLDCCGGSAVEVRKCTATLCPLWPMRMGRNPFHACARAAGPAETAEFGGSEADGAGPPPPPSEAFTEF